MIEAERTAEMNPERRLWSERVADAARRAADELRALDDPAANALIEDLDGLTARLAAELRPNGNDA